MENPFAYLVTAPALLTHVTSLQRKTASPKPVRNQSSADEKENWSILREIQIDIHRDILLIYVFTWLYPMTEEIGTSLQHF